MSDKKKIKVKDIRNHINVGKRLHSEIDEDKLKSIISESLKEGIDPYTALSIAMKESNLGTKRADYGVNHYPPLEEIGVSKKRKEIFSKYGFTMMNTPGYNYDNIIKAEKKFGVEPVKKDIQEFLQLREKEKQLSSEVNSWSPEKLFVKTIKNKFDYASKFGFRDDLMKIQAFNGLGYNADYKANLKDNPIYGREILDIRENIFKKNSEIKNIIESVKSNLIYNQLQSSPTSAY